MRIDRPETTAPEPRMTKADWWVLWTHHHEAELQAAGKQDYVEAQDHKERAAEIRRYLEPDET